MGHRGSHCGSYIGEEARANPIRVFARDGKGLSMTSGYVLRPPLAVDDPIPSPAKRGHDVERR